MGLWDIESTTAASTNSHEERAGKASAPPEPPEGSRNPAHEIRRRAAEDEEARRKWASIGLDPQDRDEFRPLLCLIQDHQAALRLESRHGLREAAMVAWIFEVEVLRRALPGNQVREGRLPALLRAEEQDDGIGAEQPLDRIEQGGPAYRGRHFERRALKM